jgi:flagella basal body P-ring formation protein FlgA
MPWVAALVIAALVQASAAAAEVQLTDREIRLDDLAVAARGAADNMQNPIVARIPAGASRVEIDAETARRLIRNRIPAARFVLGFDDRIVFLAPQAVARTGVCYAAARSVPEGQIITAADVEPAPCGPRERVEAVAHDREALAPYARRSIAAAEYLGQIRPARERRIARNREVTLVTGGPGVAVARSVTTLQPGREGEMVFIRTADGAVFAVPLSNLAED